MRSLKLAGVALVVVVTGGGGAVAASAGAPAAVGVARSSSSNAAQKAPLAAPDGLGVVPGDGSATLTWAAVAGAVSYRVQRDGNPIATVLAPEAGYLDTDVANGVDVTYRVLAVDASGRMSAPSAEATVRPLPPAPGVPTRPRATAGDSEVTLTWPATAHGYVVTRDGEEVATVTTPGWTDAAATNGTTYAYAVRAVDRFGQRSGASPSVTAKPVAPAPVTPTGLVAVESSGKVVLSWNVSVRATAYTVLRDNVAVSTVDSESYVDTAVKAGSTHTYRVRARGEAGLTSALSAAVSVTLAAPAVEAPVAGPTLTTVSNGAGAKPFISANGRYVAFTAFGTGTSDVYVYDRTTKKLTRDGEGGEAVGISADGRYVAFTVERELYVRDRRLGSTAPVGDGGVVTAAMSADGEHLAYTAVADGTVDVFVHTLGVSTRLATTGVPIASAAAYGVAISADGRYVAFVSDAADLVAGDTNGTADVFVHDRVAETFARVSVATGGGQAAEGGMHRPGISTDGRYVSFSSTSSDLVPGDTNGRADVFVHDRTLGVTLRVGAPSDVDVRAEAMSADGRYVTFRSVTPGRPEEIFVFDREAGTARLLHAGAGSSISADGRHVAFHAMGADAQQVYLLEV
ncbi:hypothetical protein Val02_52400 [Virgisporangium aliadipatigenens]|uniref:Fibronectin type-III domain-containing protein n=1 Tax=Virgisporangium aliadipatigenens TaxID=741659 RepID=A0A8J4DS54_9ACTN|nr:PD40 domain-containing protein [Virgisporangium aliadipatigenens]GIJ48354.1 hypothetical protein Val02_52400 [Virgisporangium aliadipatigenens]